MNIHLGYEIGTGQPVEIPLSHMAITGMTQQSGKTTALEALISRSGLRALTFVTKRGESAFTNAQRTPPYFREQADWQYVASLLEATMRERLKFERSWIMKVSKGARTLADVQHNIETGLVTARGLNESVLTTLHAYLEIVLPQIQYRKFAPAVVLLPGINVMDISDMSLELQMLVVRSSLEWIYEKESNTVCLIPEAWEMIPQQRGSPVKLACEQLIRKGGALKNFLWLDSQDIASVNNDILRSVRVWILGVQRERNEVKRALDHMSGAAKPKLDQVMELGLGEFFVCYGKTIERVYVQPVWASAKDSQQYAVDGELVPNPPKAIAKKKEDPEMEWKKRYKELFDRFKEQAERLKRLESAAHTAPDSGYASPPNRREPSSFPRVTEDQAGPAGTINIDDLYSQFRTRLMKDPGVIEMLSRRPEIRVTVDRPVIELNETDGLRGRVVRLLVDGFFDSVTAGHAAFKELQRRGVAVAKPSVYRELDKLAELGFVFKEQDGYQKNPEAVITKSEGAKA